MPADSTFSPLTENNDPASPSHSLMGHGMSVLVVEDDDVMRNLLVRSMERLGFNVQQASNAKEALQKFDEHRFHLIMLDVLLPDRNGFDVCVLIRQKSDVPIVMITSLNQSEDVIRGLQLGADNYITKPFNFKELEARIHAVLRRSSRVTERHSFEVAEVGDLKLYNDSQEVELVSRRIALTPIEFSLLSCLVSHADRPVSNEELLQDVWGYSDTESPNLVALTVRRLRTKVEADPSNPVRIVNVRGIGYKYVSQSTAH